MKDEVENKPDVVEPEIKPDVKDEAENKPEVVEPEIKPEVKEESDPSNESKTQSDEAADIKKESEPEAQIKNDVDEQTESESKTVMVGTRVKKDNFSNILHFCSAAHLMCFFPSIFFFLDTLIW